jgi:hypothetical protein
MVSGEVKHIGSAFHLSSRAREAVLTDEQVPALPRYQPR